jgi:hypothetical protein
MKKRLWIGLLASFLMPVAAMAQNAFNGTWKSDLSKTTFPAKPEVFLLQDGMYQCKTCVPPIEAKADGNDQKVTGHPYFDAVSIEILDDRTIQESDKKNGRTVATITTTVSPDGNTATFVFTDSSNTSAAPVTGQGESTRLAKGPPGSHAISGSWRFTKIESLSAASVSSSRMRWENSILRTFKVEGGSLTMTNPTGQGYTAKLDGTEAPYHGDPGTTSVSVKQIGKNTIDETDKRNGKVISVTRMTVAPDGKSMTFAITDKLQGTTSQFVAEKQ